MPFSDIFPGFPLGLDTTMDDSMPDTIRQRRRSEANDRRHAYFAVARDNRTDHERLRCIAKSANAQDSVFKSTFVALLRALRPHQRRYTT